MSSNSPPVVPCFHCGLPVRDPTQYTLEIEGVFQPMCCPGCQAVASTIIGNGLENYYHYRSERAIQGNREGLDQYRVYDEPEYFNRFVQPNADGEAGIELLIEGITCAACVWLLEKHLQSLKGVTLARVNLSQHRMYVRWHVNDLALSQIFQAVQYIGYRAQPYQASAQDQLQTKENRHALRRLGVAGIGMMQVGMFAIGLYAVDFNGIEPQYQLLLRWISFLVSTPIVLYSALPFYKAAWRSILTRHATMDVPVSIAIITAYVASVWATLRNNGEVYYDSVTMFVFLLLVGRYLEMRARHRFARNQRNWESILPASVNRITHQHEVEQIPLPRLRVGDQIVVKPGEIIAADGIITAGASHIDESAFTGEYQPVRRETGDKVTGGTINISSPVTVSVCATGEELQLSAVLRLINRAQDEKPAVADLADRASSYFVLALLILTAAVAGYWYWTAPDKAFWIALSVLVVTCPCALSLATPTALTVATTALRERGFLVSRGHAFDALTQLTHVIFDKTGTLTEGRLTLSEITGFTSADEAELRELAASLEQYSEHPIARAFRDAPIRKLPTNALTNHAGLGIEGVLDGHRYRIGSRRFISQWHDLTVADASSGQTLYLANQEYLLARFVLTDHIRGDAATTVAALKKRGLKTELLTGDSSAAGVEVGNTLGIDLVHTGANPQDKLTLVQERQRQGARVLVIGDGINDAPVLGAADVSIAMANASDLAKASADCLLISPQLSTVIAALDHAGKTRNVIIENILWALLYNFGSVPLAAMGMIPPYLAAVGMSVSSLIVIVNALRLSKVTLRR